MASCYNTIQHGQPHPSVTPARRCRWLYGHALRWHWHTGKTAGYTGLYWHCHLCQTHCVQALCQMRTGQDVCETLCQTYGDVCQIHCQTLCQTCGDVCQPFCQTYGDVCQTHCQTYRQDVCQTHCQTHGDVCQTLCQTYRQDVCQTLCQAYRQDVCQANQFRSQLQVQSSCSCPGKCS